MSEACEGSQLNHRSNVDLSRFLQFPLNLLVLRGLPPSWGRTYLRMLGRAYYSCFPEQQTNVRFALEACLPAMGDLSEEDSRWSRVRSGIVDHYFEKLFLGSQRIDRIRENATRKVRLTGLDLLHETMARKKGLILVTGHYGAVEFIPGALGFRGYPVTIMVHCKTAGLQKILEKKAQAAGVKLLDPKAKSVFFSAVKDLKEGRILITQCDEIDSWRPYRDRTVKFLGMEVGLDKSLDILAQKSEAPVIFGLNHRHANGLYELHLQRPGDHPAAAGQDLISAQCLSVLSSYIYKHPEAWYEWKKIPHLLNQARLEVSHEDRQRLAISDKMAVRSASAA